MSDSVLIEMFKGHEESTDGKAYLAIIEPTVVDLTPSLIVARLERGAVLKVTHKDGKVSVFQLDDLKGVSFSTKDYEEQTSQKVTRRKSKLWKTYKTETEIEKEEALVKKTKRQRKVKA